MKSQKQKKIDIDNSLTMIDSRPPELPNPQLLFKEWKEEDKNGLVMDAG